MPPNNLDLLATVYGPTTWDVYDQLDQSRSPSGPHELLEIAGDLLTEGDLVLDAGCRDATHLIELVARFGVAGVGVEPVPIHVERANAAVADASLEDRISVHQTPMQSIPIADDVVDLIWCRDVFEQVDGVAGALRELARVAKPNAPMVLFTTVVTGRLTGDDRTILGGHLGNIEENLERGWLESRFGEAGFVVDEVRSIGTEWREYAEERTQPVSKALLRLARLRQRSDEMRAEHGEKIYRHVEANLHWELFQFLGKLDPLVYTLRNAPAAPGSARS